MFTKAVQDDARIIFASVCADFGADLVEMDSEGDHVHRLVIYTAKVVISTLVEQPQGRAVVAQRLRLALWRRPARHHPPVHRAAADAKPNLMRQARAYLQPEHRSLRR